jgi:uncharacterized protein YjeT (DUF2065 family)
MHGKGDLCGVRRPESGSESCAAPGIGVLSEKCVDGILWAIVGFIEIFAVLLPLSLHAINGWAAHHQIDLHLSIERGFVTKARFSRFRQNSVFVTNPSVDPQDSPLAFDVGMEFIGTEIGNQSIIVGIREYIDKFIRRNPFDIIAIEGRIREIRGNWWQFLAVRENFGISANQSDFGRYSPYVPPLNKERTASKLFDMRYHFCSLGKNDRLGIRKSSVRSYFPRLRLTFDVLKRSESNVSSGDTYEEQTYTCESLRKNQMMEVGIRVIIGIIAFPLGCVLVYIVDDRDRNRLRRFLLTALGLTLIGSGLGAFFLPVYWQTCNQDSENCQPSQHVIFPSNHEI